VVLEDMSAQGVEELRSLGQLSLAHSALVFATFPQNEAFQALNLSSPQVLFVKSLKEGGRGGGGGGGRFILCGIVHTGGSVLFERCESAHVAR
jgi:hypothetical protein